MAATKSPGVICYVGFSEVFPNYSPVWERCEMVERFFSHLASWETPIPESIKMLLPFIDHYSTFT